MRLTWGHLRRALEAFLDRYPLFQRLPPLLPEHEQRLRELAQDVPPALMHVELRCEEDRQVWHVLDGRLLEFPQREPEGVC